MGVGTGSYFSPHVGQQPYFQQRCVFGALPVADALSAHVVSLPLSDFLTVADVGRICEAFRTACGAQAREQVA
jgi:dTDP-4-amino-4,6-dideoxygalactose transaminase